MKINETIGIVKLNETFSRLAPRVLEPDFIEQVEQEERGRRKFTTLKPLPTIRASDLLTGRYTPPVHIITNLLRPGYAVLGGAKSGGKTALALDLAAAISDGGKALGFFPCQQGKVLYLALEQSQSEFRELLKFKGKPFTNMEILTSETDDLKRLDNGGLAQIEDCLNQTKNLKAVFIDVLESWYTTNRGYSENYKVLPTLHKMGLDHNCAIVALHHTRKQTSNDATKEITGDIGIVGTSSSVLVLERRKDSDKQAGGILAVAGRLPSQKYQVEFNPLTLSFKCLGTISGEDMSPERQFIFNLLKSAADTMGNGAILKAFHKAGRKDKTSQAVKVMLSAMVKDGDIVRTGRGRYSVR